MILLPNIFIIIYFLAILIYILKIPEPSELAKSFQILNCSFLIKLYMLDVSFGIICYIYHFLDICCCCWRLWCRIAVAVVNGVGGIWWWWWWCWNEYCFWWFIFLWWLGSLATHPIKMKISSYAGAFCGLFLFWRRFSFLSFGRGAVIKAQQLSIYILWIS